VIQALKFEVFTKISLNCPTDEMYKYEKKSQKMEVQKREIANERNKP
jgi:hypothetical protein